MILRRVFRSFYEAIFNKINDLSSLTPGIVGGRPSLVTALVSGALMV
jgi:hypothetical protein